MDRRKFLRNGSLTGVGLTAIGIGSLQASVSGIFGEHDDTSIHPVQQAPALELEEITVADLQKKMQSGEQTSVSITKAYLARIEQIDRNGPSLNSIIELNPEALQIAENLDKERKLGKVRGLLHGIPILVKDNI